MVRISDCIDGWDLDGEGETVDDALLAIAEQCTGTADTQEKSIVLLRAAATRYLAMREVKP